MPQGLRRRLLNAEAAPSRRFPALLVVALLLGLIASAAAATGETAAFAGGAILRGTDPDIALPYAAPPAVTVCYIDMDGSGHYSPGDSVALTFQGNCAGPSQPGDLRLATWGGHAAGERLRSAPDAGLELRGLTPEPRFYFLDADATGQFTPGDTVYLRMHNAEHPRVMLGDVRITATGGFQAGTQVLTTDPDWNLALNPLGTPLERIRHADVTGTNTFTGQDHVFLTTDPLRSLAGPGDVRLYSPETEGTYGTYLRASDPGASRTATLITRSLCFVDLGPTGAYIPGDPLYISRAQNCAGTVRTGDLRMSTTDHGPAGTRVMQDDHDHGAAYGSLPNSRVRYVDADGSGTYGRGEPVIVNILVPAEPTARAGDLVLTPTERGAGAVLMPGDPLIGTDLRDLGLLQTMLAHKSSTESGGLTQSDALYLAPGLATGQGLRPYDIRLVATPSHPFGGPVGMETGELLVALTRGSTAICVNPASGAGYQAGDAVYLHFASACPGTVQPGLVRLVPVGAAAAFNVTRAGDTDIGRQLVAPSAQPQLRYLSIGEIGWSHTSRLYLNLVTPGENQVRVGDIRLTPAGEGHPAGRAVLSGDIDLSFTNLETLGNVDSFVAYVDIDKDAQFGVTDFAYFAPNLAQTHVTPLSVRLTRLPVPFVAPDVTDSPPPGPGTQNPPPGEDPPGNGDDGPADASDDEPAARTPAVALLWVVLSVLLLASLGRRPGAPLAR